MSVIIDLSANRSYEAKIADPKMTLQNNPLAYPVDPMRGIKDYNFDRLMKDASLRSCPVRGKEYSAIMDTRYKGE